MSVCGTDLVLEGEAWFADCAAVAVIGLFAVEYPDTGAVEVGEGGEAAGAAGGGDVL